MAQKKMSAPLAVSWTEDAESARYHPFISAPPDKKMREGADESEACIAGQQWLSPIAKPQRGSAQITHSADKKLVISIDKKHRASD